MLVLPDTTLICTSSLVSVGVYQTQKLPDLAS